VAADVFQNAGDLTKTLENVVVLSHESLRIAATMVPGLVSVYASVEGVPIAVAAMAPDGRAFLRTARAHAKAVNDALDKLEAILATAKEA